MRLSRKKELFFNMPPARLVGLAFPLEYSGFDFFGKQQGLFNHFISDTAEVLVVLQNWPANPGSLENTLTGQGYEILLFLNIFLL
jgi:hypothetical protein